MARELKMKGYKGSGLEEIKRKEQVRVFESQVKTKRKRVLEGGEER